MALHAAIEHAVGVAETGVDEAAIFGKPRHGVSTTQLNQSETSEMLSYLV